MQDYPLRTCSIGGLSRECHVSATGKLAVRGGFLGFHSCVPGVLMAIGPEALLCLRGAPGYWPTAMGLSDAQKKFQTSDGARKRLEERTVALVEGKADDGACPCLRSRHVSCAIFLPLNPRPLLPKSLLDVDKGALMAPTYTYRKLRSP